MREISLNVNEKVCNLGHNQCYTQCVNVTHYASPLIRRDIAHHYRAYLELVDSKVTAADQAVASDFTIQERTQCCPLHQKAHSYIAYQSWATLNYRTNKEDSYHKQK